MQDDAPSPAGTAGQGNRTWRVAATLALVLALGALRPYPATAQTCIGDCDYSKDVTVVDLMTMVNVALGNAAVTQCTRGDRNGDGTITIDEITAAVRFALDPQQFGLHVEGACEVPGATGLVACGTGTVRLIRCAAGMDCENDPNARIVMQSTSVGANGLFALDATTDCAGASARYVLEATVADAGIYRFGDIGPIAAQGAPAARAASAEPSPTPLISPNSEAAVRLVAANGFANFGAQTFSDLLSAVTDANPPDTFKDLSVAAAADKAKRTADTDKGVRTALASVLRHDKPVATSIEPKGNIDDYTFELHDPTTVVLQVTRADGTLQPCIEVRAFGSSQPVEGGAACGDDSVRLNLTLPPGPYAVLVQDRDSLRTGSYELYYLRLRPEDIGEVPVGSQSLDLGDLDPYKFTVSQASSVIFQATQVAGAIAPCVELWQFGLSGSTLVRTVCDPSSARIDQVVNAGTYFAVVYDQGSTDVGSYSMQLVVVPVPTPTPTQTQCLSGIRSWDVSADYSSASNPNGVWSYGRRWTTDGDAFDLMTVRWGTSGWYFGNVGHGGPSIQAGVAMWAKNNTNGFPAVRWTSPESGYYSIVPRFTGADSRGVNVDVFVVIDGSLAFTGHVQADQDTEDFSVDGLYLSQGSHVDFIVEWAGGTYSEYNWTQLTGQISQLGCNAGPSSTPTPSVTPRPPTVTPTSSPIATGTQTPTPTPTQTPSPTWTPTASPTTTLTPTPSTTPAASPEPTGTFTVFRADFEAGWGDWYADNGIWQVGLPTSGPGNCFNGSAQCAATNLSGSYPDNSSSHLISPNIQLPEITADQEIRLRLEQWVSMGGWDTAIVQVSYETAPRVWGAWETVDSYSTSSGTWAHPLLDISKYAGKKVRLGFLLSQGNSGWPNYSTAVGPGWYIDDVEVTVVSAPALQVTGATPFRENFEGGWGDWYTNNSIWDVGLPTSGPKGCFNGSAQCAATTLDGNYPDNSSTYLVSPKIQLPEITADQEIRLRLEQWVSMGGWDGAYIQVSYETAPRVWSAWEDVNSYSTSSGTWAHPLLDISKYAGKKVRLGFLLSQGNSGWPNYSTGVGPGWYIDDVEITVVSAPAFQVTGATAFRESFEGGWGDWYTHNSIWDVGLPTSGPKECFNGSAQCAATTLDGNYPDNSSTYLVSPKIQLPEISADEEIRLRLEQWVSMGGWDGAYIQVSYETAPRVWSAWEDVNSYSTSSGTWAYPLLDISKYAGKKVRLGFLLSQGNSGWPNYSTGVGPGWYIDDVEITVVSAPAFQVTGATPFRENFEGGWGDWWAHNSIWDVGLPTSGPKGCFNGSQQCATTTLGGNYPDNSSSYLVSPKIQLPEITADQEIRLRLEQWVAMGSWDSAIIQVSYETDPRVWSAWETVDSYSTPASSGTWGRPLLDISKYAGKKVRLGFLLSQGNSGWPNYSTATGPGWYIDDVEVTVASASAFQVTGATPFREDFEGGWGDWYANNSIWELGPPTSGPKECFNGSTQCVATTLNGNYPDNSSSYLVSPKIQLPEITPDQEIRLRLQQWISMGSWDTAIVQVSYETAPRVWGAWETVDSYSTSSLRRRSSHTKNQLQR